MRQRVQSNASPTWRGMMALLAALDRRPLPDRLTREALGRHMDLLASTALINVKKRRGGGSADLLELGATRRRDAQAGLFELRAAGHAM